MRPLVLALTLASAPALAQAPTTFSITDGTVSYKLVHKFHEITGTSKKVEGKARILPNGTVQVMARAPVASFDSGNDNRDAHMLETVEGGKYPLVELKAVAEGLTLPSRFPASVKAKLKGAIVFHSVRSPQEVEVTVTFPDADHLTVFGSFPISLEAFKVERPSLMFVKVEDKLGMEAKLNLTREK
jgi:hypothetical protein